VELLRNSPGIPCGTKEVTHYANNLRTFENKNRGSVVKTKSTRRYRREFYGNSKVISKWNFRGRIEEMFPKNT
jgi:hypothetical protein